MPMRCEARRSGCGWNRWRQRVRTLLIVLLGVCGLSTEATAQTLLPTERDAALDALFADAGIPLPLPESVAAAAEPSASPAPVSGSKPKSYFVPSRSTSTRPEREPPHYVRNSEQVDFFDDRDVDWLDFGLDYRMRYEYRDDDVRRPVALLDEPFLLRTRLYLGVREQFDPLRGYIEFEDARRYNSHFPEDNRDVNQYEIIQAVGELYFADALGDDRPLRLQAGRMAFEYVDRRLIGRNEWRNTTNNFQGFRGILGQKDNDWQLDILALQPMERLLTRPDRVDEERWFYGFIVDWRRWSEYVTFQPYYLVLDQNGKEDRINRNIHTVGLRAYGNVPGTGYDFDVQEIFQFGRHGGGSHRALAFTGEIGYTFDHPSKPRLGAFIGYASGDRDPNDNRNERFERLFGFARPWSSNDYITFDNIVTPKARLEFQPHERVRIDAGYSAYWLASATDLWANAQLRDPTGASGDFMGHEFDVRVRLAVGDRTDVTLGYAHFIPGAFTRNTGKPNDTDFFYVEVSPRLIP